MPDDPAIIVLCTLASEPSLFDDDVRGTCLRCGVAVKHRPEHTGRQLICFACMGHEEDIEGFAITPRTLAELRALGFIK
jgi:hypothetical protein